MYRISKTQKGWYVKNNTSGAGRWLSPAEVEGLLAEFPHLRNSHRVTYFRNRLSSVNPLP
jgi:hypothetical protein